MTTNYLKQITLATIGTGCIALGVATEAQAAALSGTLEVSGLQFNGDEIRIELEDMMYLGTGDFLAPAFSMGTVSTESFSSVSTMNPIDHFFTSESGGIDYSFTLTSAIEVDDPTNVEYNFAGTVEDEEGHITHWTGLFLAAHGDQASWSVSLETKRVPEPSTMIGLLGITTLGLTTLRKAKRG
ncbi:PEP-CTERM sorting domain-containing protein [Okeania sp. KiyG1]|uniref:PEP-CTERM sorting domain-containing protein n=1 Tax=Okeania sp. KiyG1 TaxID=2720165 RepID=UPI001924E6FA|nr:PEP-CTERM sorting domain-containing protein [Okeania sp. KiyG1]GGA51221.1 hypothetical protein CYANOKiyG1_70900 [Okeania sp. KiyG1]